MNQPRHPARADIDPMRPRGFWWRCALAAFLGGSPASARAQVANPPEIGPPGPGVRDDRRPEGARRLLRQFDFEERESNPDPIPQFWYRGQDDPSVPRVRPGFPGWNQAELEYGVGDGRFGGCVRLPTKGGSTSLVLDPGVLVVLPGADYVVTSRIRTRGLLHARARVVARFLDAQSKVIAGSEVSSALVVSEGGWAPASIELVGRRDGAAFIQLELQVVQPSQVEPAKLGVHHVYAEDLDGAAWFDDVAVSQLPRIEFVANGASNIVTAPERPRLSLSLRDLTGEELSSTLEIRDVDGAAVYRDERVLGTGAVRAQWEPTLPRFGWYEAELHVRNKSGDVALVKTTVVWLPAEDVAVSARTGPLERRRFGLIVSGWRPELAGSLPRVMHDMASGSVTIPAWPPDLTPEGAGAAAAEMSGLLDGLLSAGSQVTLGLSRVPSALASQVRVENDDVWAALVSNGEDWKPYLSPILNAHGPRVRRWQVGRTGDDRAFWRGGLVDDVARLSSEFSSFVAAPVVDLPWRIDRAIESIPGKGVSATVVAPWTSTEDAVLSFSRRWRERGGGTPLTLVIEPPGDGSSGRAAADQVFRRAVLAWSELGGMAGADAPTLAIGQPWEWSAERTPRASPSALAAGWRAVTRALAGRVVIGEYRAIPGVRCFVLAPRDSRLDEGVGALVLWNESAPAGEAVLNSYLGDEKISVVDVFGNRADAPLDPGYVAPVADATGRVPVRHQPVRVPITESPIVVEGVDHRLVRFLASIELSPRELPAVNTTHERSIRFQNPWAGTLDVKFFVVSPGGVDAGGLRDRSWIVKPRASRATVLPGTAGVLPLTIAYPPSEEAGERAFVIDVEPSTDRAYGLIRVVRHMSVGLPEIEMRLASIGLRNGDLIVEAHVENTSGGPINVELTAFAPGTPRIKATISELAPGAHVARRFSYPKGLGKLAGGRVYVSATMPDTTARLNKSVLIER
ncbi:MAG: hypothetical protein JNL50_03845 [Phycisphaerae bacterium]|nr:hypothetical protein [Phycisphaerae bacterium]